LRDSCVDAVAEETNYLIAEEKLEYRKIPLQIFNNLTGGAEFSTVMQI
jgi:hypothetical protein